MAMVNAPVERKRAIERRLEATAWGLCFIMVGGLLLLPSETVPHGTWLVAAGLILLGLNVARLMNGLAVGTISVALGALALIAGIASFAGLRLPVLPLVLIVIGAEILFKAARSDRRQAL
jgi:hypothetical protein